MAYTRLTLGSKGDDVKKLQTELNKYGYGLDVDGSFGQKTNDAVRDYQSKNGLSVDGVVGNNTWGKLVGSSTNNASSGGNTATSSKPTYTQSDVVTQAMNMLQNQQANKPGAYTSSYSDQIAALMDKINNRESFEYDFNADPLYQQYKNQYTNLGRLAMEDTMGQAAMLSGGYGNSYATTAGNQAYQSYLNELNNIIPELYNAALNRYQMEGNELKDNLSLLTDMDNIDYNRYRDNVSDYYTELNYLTDDARYKAEDDYNKYLQEYAQWESDRNFNYQKEVDDRNFNYQKEQDERNWAYQQERDAISDARYESELAAQQAAAATGNSELKQYQEEQLLEYVQNGDWAGLDWYVDVLRERNLIDDSVAGAWLAYIPDSYYNDTDNDTTKEDGFSTSAYMRAKYGRK